MASTQHLCIMTGQRPCTVDCSWFLIVIMTGVKTWQLTSKTCLGWQPWEGVQPLAPSPCANRSCCSIAGALTPLQALLRKRWRGYAAATRHPQAHRPQGPLIRHRGGQIGW